MSKQVQCVVITPEAQVVETEAESVVFTAHDGELGVLSGRAPLMCELGIGQVRYTANGQSHRVYIDGGFAQVYEDCVTVLTGDACKAEEVDADRVSRARKSLEALETEAPHDHDARKRALQRVRVLEAMA